MKPKDYDWQLLYVKGYAAIESILHQCGFVLTKTSKTGSRYYHREGFEGCLLRVSDHSKKSTDFRGQVVVARHTIVGTNSNETELKRLYQAMGKYMHLAEIEKKKGDSK